MNELTDSFHQTLKDQYQQLGLPTDLIHADTDFTIFNLNDLHQPLPFRSPVSRLDFFVFAFVKQAHGQYVLDDQTFPLQPGTVYFTNPGHYRSFDYTALDEVYLITLNESFLKENVEPNVYEEFPFLLAETLPAIVLTDDVFAEFERIYLQIYKEYWSHSPFRNRLIGSLFVVLLLKFKEYFWLDYNAIYEGNRSSDIVKTFKRTLEKHYRDLADGRAEQVFRVQDYADLLNLHPNYLSTVIKSKTGKTIGSWIAERNIAEARSLLQNTSVSIKEIAYRLGFSDPAHFSNYFKKHTAIAPMAYRKSHAPAAP